MQQLLWCVLLLAASGAEFIPREKISNRVPTIRLSPDGELIAYVAPDDDGVNNAFTKRVSDGQTRQVTFEDRDVFNFYWTAVRDIVLFELDIYGDENVMIFKRNISEDAPKDDRTIISNIQGVKAYMFDNNKRDPFVLIGLNDVMPSYHNIYKFDLLTNELTLVFTDQRFTALNIITDNAMRIRLAKEEQEDGSTVYYRVSSTANPEKLTSDDADWEEYLRVRPDDVLITIFLGFDESNENMYWIWGEDTDLGSLVLAPLKNFEERKVLYTAIHAQQARRDFLFHPKDRTILQFVENYHKPEVVFVNDTVAEDMQYLRNLRPNNSIYKIEMSEDIKTWLVTYSSATNPYKMFTYQRVSRTAKLLFESTLIDNHKLSRQIGFDFIARDGLVLQAYLSLPPDALLKSAADVSAEDRSLAEQGMIPGEPQKMVLFVHGGPMTRDHYGYLAMNAFLTSRGYAVLQVNFRGSLGFGKRIYNAGNGEWSKKMHDDLIDAVNFAITKGIANRSAVAIMGPSYGGYATLVGLTKTPDTFACGIDIVGPSNLITLLDSIPPYWQGMRKQLYKNTGGDIETEQGRQALIERSPLFMADKVKKPLMIIQGANDARVKQKESEQFVAALKNHSIPVTYVLFPDEGHFIRRAPNQLAQYGLIETFLHECLGGEYQPFTDGQYNESAIIESFGPAPATVSYEEMFSCESFGDFLGPLPILITCLVSFYVF